MVTFDNGGCGELMLEGITGKACLGTNEFVEAVNSLVTNQKVSTLQFVKNYLSLRKLSQSYQAVL